MSGHLPPRSFLETRSTRTLLDVRAPGEYAQGHIPGAKSFPLFSDIERADVGRTYKQIGQEQAMELGLRIVGPKLEGFVQQAKLLAPNRHIALHCWRGGQRSGSMAWLLHQAGFDVVTLEGGYKSYRRFVLQSLEQTPILIRVLGGKTGVGKTKILHALRDLGEQIIDLEEIAHHKGSAFGFIGEKQQPSVEQFENELFERVQRLDLSRHVWMENESRSIGRVFIPAGFWEKMRVAPLVVVEVPESTRIQNLLGDYAHADPADLEKAFHKIASKLGGLNLKMALEALQTGNLAEAARIALIYYDKTYQFGLESSTSPDIRRLQFEQEGAVEIANALMQLG